MSRQQFQLLKKYSEVLGLQKTPVRKAESETSAEPNTFFSKWERLRDWFEDS